MVDRNRLLLERLDRGAIDLVLAMGNGTRADGTRLATLPCRWIGPARLDPVWSAAEPVPLAVYEAPCFFRQRALDALDRAGIPWRIAFTSPNLSGLWAAVAAGLGITLRTAVGLPAGVRALTPDARLPLIESAVLEVCLHDAARPSQPALSRPRSIIIDTVRDGIADGLDG